MHGVGARPAEVTDAELSRDPQVSSNTLPHTVLGPKAGRKHPLAEMDWYRATPGSEAAVTLPLFSVTAEVQHIAPNASSRERARREAVAKGLPATAAGDRPALADNSTLKYFPPIQEQRRGDCGAYAAAYYYNTYTQARARGLDASSGDPTVLCSPRFIFSLVAQGFYGALGARYIMGRLADVGCAPVSLHGFNVHWNTWPTEAAWVAALRNRTGTPRSIRADTTEGLEAIRQHMANGGCVVTRAMFYENYWHDEFGYPNNDTAGIDNYVYYARVGDPPGGPHTFCLVGYDDNRSYVDHRDGQTHYGAFIAAETCGTNYCWYNSTGTGGKGFSWFAYTLFLEGEFGYYDDPSGLDKRGCYDNAPYPEVYYNDERPAYRPRLYAVVGINHPDRNVLTLTGGLGSPLDPEFTGPNAIEKTKWGTYAIDDTRRVAVDLTESCAVFQPGLSRQVFVSLNVDTTAVANATITSTDFFGDPDGDGLYVQLTSTNPPLTVMPGETAYATARLPRELCVDAANTNGPWDGTLEHPYSTIQVCVENADAGATIWVYPALYSEHVVISNPVTLIGAGPESTAIHAPPGGEAVLVGNAVGVLVSGFTLATVAADTPALRSTSATITVRDCVAVDSYSGFAVGGSGRATFVNCMALSNTHNGFMQSADAQAAIYNATVVGNGSHGIQALGTAAVEVVNSILWDNADDIEGASVLPICCDIADGDFQGTNSNISLDPCFVRGAHGTYCLSHTAAGQATNSPCVDAGASVAAAVGLDIRSTRTDGEPDTEVVDMGYHFPGVTRIDSIAVGGGAPIVQWTGHAGVLYSVESSSDLNTWQPAGTPGEDWTWTDTEWTGGVTHRYLRVRRHFTDWRAVTTP